MYLLDSNVLREYLRSNATLQAHLQRVSRDELALPSAVAAEALRGRCEYALKAEPAQSVAAHALLLETLQTVVSFHLITFNQASAATLAELLRRHQSRKRYADVMIAALALAGGHVLVTRNQKHFADLLPPAQLQNWLDDPPHR